MFPWGLGMPLAPCLDASLKHAHQSTVLDDDAHRPQALGARVQLVPAMPHRDTVAAGTDRADENVNEPAASVILVGPQAAASP